MLKQPYFSFFLLLGLFCLGSFHPRPKTENTLDSDSDSNEHGVVETDHKTNCSCGWANKDDQRIVGGKVTKVNEYPMIAGFVSLHFDMVTCGGTILTPLHIVTAAHCTQWTKPSDYGIFVGHHNYKKVKHHHKLLEPKEFIVHEKFDSNTIKYDISIVIMKNPIEFNKNVGPACLPKTNDLDVTGQRVKIIGWGLTKFQGSPSDVLLKVNVDVQQLDMCLNDNEHLELVDRHQICTYRKHKDSCSQDSGGPVLWRDDLTNRYTLVALVSYGKNCAKYPAVNSQITYFLPWIQQTISETASPSMRTCARI